MATILVVDDEPALRKLLRQMAEMAGHSVVEAENGRLALQMFRSHRPDILIADIIMPQKDGIELIAEIRREAPEALVIAISGGGRTRNMDVLRIATRAGADAVLEKPFRSGDLVETIDRLMDRG